MVSGLVLAAAMIATPALAWDSGYYGHSGGGHGGWHHGGHYHSSSSGNGRTYSYPSYYSHGSGGYNFSGYTHGSTIGMTGFNGNVGTISNPHRSDWERRLRYDAEVRAAAREASAGAPECGFINSPEYCFRVSRLYPPPPPHRSAWLDE
jgi:hypothetical protein